MNTIYVTNDPIIRIAKEIYSKICAEEGEHKINYIKLEATLNNTKVLSVFINNSTKPFIKLINEIGWTDYKIRKFYEEYLEIVARAHNSKSDTTTTTSEPITIPNNYKYKSDLKIFRKHE